MRKGYGGKSEEEWLRKLKRNGDRATRMKERVKDIR